MTQFGIFDGAEIVTVVNGVAKGVSKGVVVTLFGDIRRFQASLTAPKDGICVREGGT